MSLEVIAALLGHKSMRMTMVYPKIANRTVADEYFEVATNPEPDSTLPFLIRLPLTTGVFTRIQGGREGIFWQTARTTRQARPGIRVPPPRRRTGCVDASDCTAVGVDGNSHPFHVSETASSPCSAGSWSASGNTPCTPADAGNFVAASGAKSQAQCAAGTYQPNTGQSACLPADAGHFVATTGSKTQTPCPAGSYQPRTGQSACVLAGPGFYVPSPGASAQQACASGYTSGTGATVCTVTPASLCALTSQDVDGSAKYAKLTASAKAVIDKTIASLCAADLNPITPSITQAKKKLLIGLYKIGVQALAAGGWLTSAQSSQLSALADKL